MKNQFHIMYNKESGILSLIAEGLKSVDSDIRGNAVIDYDGQGNIARIDLHNFSFDEFQRNKKVINIAGA